MITNMILGSAMTIIAGYFSASLSLALFSEGKWLQGGLVGILYILCVLGCAGYLVMIRGEATNDG